MVPASGLLLNRVLGELLGLDTMNGHVTRLGTQHVRLDPGKILEHQCFGPILPETLHLKIDGFRQKWHATCYSQTRAAAGLCRYACEEPCGNASVARRPDCKCFSKPTIPTDDPYALTRIQITIRPVHGTSGEATKLLGELGLEMLQDLRTYLGVLPERRQHKRYPRDNPIQVYPVSEHGELGEPIQGQVRDLGLGGVCLALHRAAAHGTCLCAPDLARATHPSGGPWTGGSPGACRRKSLDGGVLFTSPLAGQIRLIQTCPASEWDVS